MRGMPSWYVDADDDDGHTAVAQVSLAAGSVDGRDEDEQFRLSDLGKLARRARRRVVDVARADDRPTFAALIGDHLGVSLEGAEVVEEQWPSYDLVNVQVGLNAWLNETGADGASP